MAKNKAKMDERNKTQLIVGALSTVFSYAALGLTMSDPVKTFITDAHWQQAPLHLAFIAVTACAGMALAAGVSNFRQRRKQDAEASEPKLD